MMPMAADLARAFDPALWFADAGYEPDQWQANAVRSQSKRQLWNVHRQGGKSLTAGIKALAKATEVPGSPSLVIAPSQRQAAESVRTIISLHSKIRGLPEIIAESTHRIELANGSRVISLPSSEATVRGYSKVALLELDEASRIPDEMIVACRPMLAVSDGEIIALSTPRGTAGWFFESWVNGGDTWERVQVPVTACPRVSEAFLADEMKELGPSLYAQEYMCEFVANNEQVFPSGVIDAAFTQEVAPLWN